MRCRIEATARLRRWAINIDTSGTCTGHATDQPMTDPRLAPLGDYGDDTDFLVLETFLPLFGPAREGGQAWPVPVRSGCHAGDRSARRATARREPGVIHAIL